MNRSTATINVDLSCIHTECVRNHAHAQMQWVGARWGIRARAALAGVSYQQLLTLPSWGPDTVPAAAVGNVFNNDLDIVEHAVVPALLLSFLPLEMLGFSIVLGPVFGVCVLRWDRDFPSVRSRDSLV